MKLVSFKNMFQKLKFKKPVFPGSSEFIRVRTFSVPSYIFILMLLVLSSAIIISSSSQRTSSNSALPVNLNTNIVENTQEEQLDMIQDENSGSITPTKSVKNNKKIVSSESASENTNTSSNAQTNTNTSTNSNSNSSTSQDSTSSISPTSSVPTSTPGPTNTPTPKPTSTPTTQPSPTMVTYPVRTASMYPQGSYNPGASGTTNIQKNTQNANGYNDYHVWGTYYNLTPNRTHKIYFCASGGCSSNNELYITTNSAGSVTFDSYLYGHNDNYPLTSIKVWQDYQGILPPSDSTICPSSAIDANACLRGNL